MMQPSRTDEMRRSSAIAVAIQAITHQSGCEELVE